MAFNKSKNFITLSKIKSYFILFVFTLISCKQVGTNVGDKAPKIIYQQSFPATYSIPAGKPIVLDFWATWCGPCVAGLIESKKIIPHYSPYIEFIAITDTTSKDVQQFITNGKFPQNFIIDKDSTTFTNFKVTLIPHAFIIDQKGIIAWSGNSRDITPDMLDELLKTGKIKPIAFPAYHKRPIKDTDNQNLVIFKLMVVNRQKLDQHKSLLVSKTANKTNKGSFSNAPEMEGYLSCINYDLKEFCNRADEYFPGKKLNYNGSISEKFDFIQIPFGSFDSLNAYIENNYGLVFKKNK